MNTWHFSFFFFVSFFWVSKVNIQLKTWVKCNDWHFHWVFIYNLYYRCDVMSSLKVKVVAIRIFGEWEWWWSCGSDVKTILKSLVVVFNIIKLLIIRSFVRSILLEMQLQSDHHHPDWLQNPWNIGRDRKTDDFPIMWPRHVPNSNYYYVISCARDCVTKEMILILYEHQNKMVKLLSMHSPLIEITKLKIYGNIIANIDVQSYNKIYTNLVNGHVLNTSTVDGKK